MKGYLYLLQFLPLLFIFIGGTNRGLLAKRNTNTQTQLKNSLFAQDDFSPVSRNEEKTNPRNTVRSFRNALCSSYSLQLSIQSPKGIKWSAVPLPCSTCVCIEFFLCFYGGKQGRGQTDPRTNKQKISSIYRT